MTETYVHPYAYKLPPDYAERIGKNLVELIGNPDAELMRRKVRHVYDIRSEQSWRSESGHIPGRGSNTLGLAIEAALEGYVPSRNRAVALNLPSSHLRLDDEWQQKMLQAAQEMVEREPLRLQFFGLVLLDAAQEGEHELTHFEDAVLEPPL